MALKYVCRLSEICCLSACERAGSGVAECDGEGVGLGEGDGLGDGEGDAGGDALTVLGDTLAVAVCIGEGLLVG